MGGLRYFGLAGGFFDVLFGLEGGPEFERDFFVGLEKFFFGDVVVDVGEGSKEGGIL